jgi:hypothetical protein
LFFAIPKNQSIFFLYQQKEAKTSWQFRTAMVVLAFWSVVRECLWQSITISDFICNGQPLTNYSTQKPFTTWASARATLRLYLKRSRAANNKLTTRDIYTDPRIE